MKKYKTSLLKKTKYKNCQRVKIGTLKLLDMIHQISDKPLAEQHLFLVDYLDNLQQTTSQRDDITIIGIRI
ncbi:MAG: hypothetical protein COZ18_12790 [Flexibacter sp. CG_4_10_14_3_um_filter_32_15]|nr:MAG: hypothetical protein COZ18_12790 [Flexibacter sp. CG_4_10_14_3_um_filter_32_15]